MHNGTTQTKPLIMILDRVLLELDPPPETIGKNKKILLPEIYRTNRIMVRTGTVLSRGPGQVYNTEGKVLPMFVEVGDRVKIGAQAGYDISEDGDKDLRLVTQQEIVGIVSRASEKQGRGEG